MSASVRKPRTQSSPKIKVVKDGPYLVSGAVPLADQHIVVDENGDCHGWREGRLYATPDTYALCRCGQSKTPPFCDGQHTTAKFDGTETASPAAYGERAKVLEGPKLTLTDAPDLCASARFCHRAGGTWQLTQLSEIDEARQMAIEEAGDCPSGRLVVWDSAGRAIEPALKRSIGLVVDTQAGTLGPIWVRGGIPVESANGSTYEVRNRLTLCRCGLSGNKPFCDGSHLKQ